MYNCLQSRPMNFFPAYLVVPTEQKKQEISSLLTYEPAILVGDKGLIELMAIPMDILLVAIVGTAACHQW